MSTTTVALPFHTMQHAYQNICGGEDPWVALGNFTNDFFEYVEQREQLMNDPIEMPGDLTPDLSKWAVFCAASVDYLCQVYHLETPAWVNDSSYTAVPEPWFFSPAALRVPRIKERIERETPNAFTTRNIFCGNRIYIDKRQAATELRLKLSA